MPYVSDISIEEATEIARVASEAARIAVEVAQAATEQLAKLEEQRITGQLAEAEAVRLAAEAATASLVNAEKRLKEVNEELTLAKAACDNFLKDPSGIDDKIVHAKLLGIQYQEVAKRQVEANMILVDAKKADLPFQVPRLRDEVAALEAELAEVENKIEIKQKAIDLEKIEVAKNPALHGMNETLRNLNLHQHQNIQSRVDLTKKLQIKKGELYTAEVSAGLRFNFTHPPQHEMILRAAMNGGSLRVMCSCGSSAGLWSAECPYPPKCYRHTVQCGHVGW